MCSFSFMLGIFVKGIPKSGCQFYYEHAVCVLFDVGFSSQEGLRNSFDRENKRHTKCYIIIICYTVC